MLHEVEETAAGGMPALEASAKCTLAAHQTVAAAPDCPQVIPPVKPDFWQLDRIAAQLVDWTGPDSPATIVEPLPASVEYQAPAQHVSAAVAEDPAPLAPTADDPLAQLYDCVYGPDPGSESKADMALRRQTGLPSESDMAIAEGPAPGDQPSNNLPYMRYRLRDRLSYWRSIGTPKMVLGWLEHGFRGHFWSEPPIIRKPNQSSCYEPPEQFDFVDSFIATLLARGCIGEWRSEWGQPRVISPLKVVPKKPDTFRLILDLSKMNYYLNSRNSNMIT